MRVDIADLAPFRDGAQSSAHSTLTTLARWRDHVAIDSSYLYGYQEPGRGVGPDESDMAETSIVLRRGLERQLHRAAGEDDQGQKAVSDRVSTGDPG